LCWEQAAGVFQRAALTRPLSVSEGIPAFTTAQILAAGIGGPGIFLLLYPLSYGDLRRRLESNLQPSD
jgi:hypothetical protein